MFEPVPCIACGVQLKSAITQIDTVNQPNDGTVFSTQGQYGSTFFDTFDERESIEIVVCDACLRAHENRILHTYKDVNGHRHNALWSDNKGYKENYTDEA